MEMSVYNYETRKFDHYSVPETKAQLGVFFGQTRAPKGMTSRIGSAPEALALKLPSNARKTGTSDVPRGVMAVQPRGLLAGVGDSLIPSNPLLIAILAVVGWEITKKWMKGRA